MDKTTLYNCIERDVFTWTKRQKFACPYSRQYFEITLIFCETILCNFCVFPCYKFAKLNCKSVGVLNVSSDLCSLIPQGWLYLIQHEICSYSSILFIWLGYAVFSMVLVWHKNFLYTLQ